MTKATKAKATVKTVATAVQETLKPSGTLASAGLEPAADEAFAGSNPNDHDGESGKANAGAVASAAPAAPRNNDAQPPPHVGEVMLIGSSVQPSVQIIGDREVQLGEIVARAHGASGLNAAEWNALPDLQRERDIQNVVDALKRESGVAFVACWPLRFDGQKYPTGAELPAFSQRETASLLKMKAIQRKP